MKIEVNGREVGVKTFTFPDGQPHVELSEDIGTGNEVVITTPIRSAKELFDLLLVANVLIDSWADLRRRNRVSLRIQYLLGARMDRRIDNRQPLTLRVVADLLNSADFTDIAILDPHSEEAVKVLAAEPIYPEPALNELFSRYNVEDTVVVIPDSGARQRAHRMMGLPGCVSFPTVQCFKRRDSQTGKLSHFEIERPADVAGKRCLILDDICDGGGTFVGLADLLRLAGATSVDLFVTHGIFSKGLPLKGIDQVFCVNYASWPGTLQKASNFNTAWARESRETGWK